MTLSEAVRLMEEYGGMEFKLGDYLLEQKNAAIILSIGGDEIVSIPLLDWERTAQPVPWREALEAWAFDGAMIYCVARSGRISTYRQGEYIERSSITDGTWYIAGHGGM